MANCSFWLGIPRAIALAVSTTVWFDSAGAAEGNRYAVVIGNQDYNSAPDLKNARRDANDFATMLRENRYLVFDGYDLNREGIEALLRSAVINIPKESEVVFYFSGHGIQLGRRNYLLPTDASFQSIFDLPVQSVTLDRVIDLLSTRGKTHVAIIDACRENPFPEVQMAVDLDASLFETKAGFDVMAPPKNSLVAFSTSPGMLAYDGPRGANSPYTEAILAVSQERLGESFLSVLSSVRARVLSATEERQVPWESSTLITPFTLLPGPTPNDVPSSALPASETISGSQVTSDGVERATPNSVPDLPKTIETEISLDLNLGREVLLQIALGDALRVSEFTDIVVIEDPSDGRLDASVESDGKWALTYRPIFSELRAAGTKEYAHKDNMKIAVRDGQNLLEIDLFLNLQADACDVLAGDALDPQGLGVYVFPNEIQVEDALNACSDAWSKYPEIPRYLYQLGRAQQANGQLETAFATFSKAAELGHIRALNAAGYMMFTTNINRETTKIPLDIPNASKLLRSGINGGDPYAMHTEGQRLLRTGNSDALRQQGFELMERAVELGHTFSMNELGYYFLNKDSDHYLPERGMTYLRASAARGDIYGYNNLGLVALYGLDGSEVDYAAAYDWFEKAATGGHPFAPGNLGRMIFNGQAPNRSFDEALRWNDLGLERGDGWAGANGAALILKEGAGNLDAAEAAVRYAKAAHLPAQDAAEQARSRLSQRSDRELGQALQLVLVELGENITVDGIVGQSTVSSLRNVAERNELGPVPPAQLERLLLATKAYWSEHPTRPDLF